MPPTCIGIWQLKIAFLAAANADRSLAAQGLRYPSSRPRFDFQARSAIARIIATSAHRFEDVSYHLTRVARGVSARRQCTIFGSNDPQREHADFDLAAHVDLPTSPWRHHVSVCPRPIGRVEIADQQLLAPET